MTSTFLLTRGEKHKATLVSELFNHRLKKNASADVEIDMDE